MAHFNEKAVINRESRQVEETLKQKTNRWTTCALIFTGILFAGAASAETPDSTNSSEAETFITMEQQQQLIDWGMETQARISRNLDEKRQHRLSNVLRTTDGIFDSPAPGIDLPSEQLLCIEDPAANPDSHTETPPSACYAAISE